MLEVTLVPGDQALQLCRAPLWRCPLLSLFYRSFPLFAVIPGTIEYLVHMSFYTANIKVGSQKSSGLLRQQEMALYCHGPLQNVIIWQASWEKLATWLELEFLIWLKGLKYIFVCACTYVVIKGWPVGISSRLLPHATWGLSWKVASLVIGACCGIF